MLTLAELGEAVAARRKARKMSHRGVVSRTGLMRETILPMEVEQSLQVDSLCLQSEFNVFSA
jgi:hypothetical protein